MIVLGLAVDTGKARVTCLSFICSNTLLPCKATSIHLAIFSHHHHPSLPTNQTLSSASKLLLNSPPPTSKFHFILS